MKHVVIDTNALINTIPFPHIIVKKLDEFDKEDFLQ